MLTVSISDDSDGLDQPRMITNELLSRSLAKTAPKAIADPKELYQVLASGSIALQMSAFRILHEGIPKGQEQKSLDKALSKDYVAALPEELLSLIITAPSDEALLTADFQRETPAALRTYLCSWLLVFDHWGKSSYALQKDYVASLRDGVYLKVFLDFTFEFLITGRPRPADASKFDFMDFSVDHEDAPEQYVDRFLVHLYALCLKCIPNLTKSWWRDSTSRQTMIAVESWTDKYVRPSLPFVRIHTYTCSRFLHLSSRQSSALSALGIHLR